MCNCPSVQFYEVDFKLAGMQVVPTHKNCGDALSEEQHSKFEKELIKYWGFEEKPRYEENLLLTVYFLAS